jgi:uncharacterized protein (DUF58 family)
VSQAAAPATANADAAPGAVLRARAEALSGALPPLMAEARQLAATVLLGEHGRRRSGTGAEFWQYRPAHSGDAARAIDWRRSGRSDAQFVREREWQAAQSVMIWADRGQSMRFASTSKLPAKADRAALLALATATLLVRGGERVGLTALGTPPRTGEAQLFRIGEALVAPPEAAEYGVPSLRAMPAHARAVFLSDFLGDPAPLDAAITAAADRGVQGAALMILDPQEEAFPFDGRTIFESMGGTMSYETQRARDLKGRYLERLAERKQHLARLTQECGWQFSVHHTETPAQAPLLWLHAAIGGRR